MAKNWFNNILITKYLENENIFPEYENNNIAKYLSVFKLEKNASFIVNKNKNLWNDFSENCGGTLIDLVMKLKRLDFKNAVSYLQSLQLNSFSFNSNDIKNKLSNIEIKHIQSIQNKALIQYLSLRKIPFNWAYKYVSEIYYKIGNKQYFAIGFKNNSNGYELRNKYFKGSTHPKDITTIEIKNSQSINIFEGFFDYLTALQYFKTDKPNQTTIILNSTTNINKTLSIIKQYKTVNLFLDNDKSGKNAVKTYQTAHPNIKNRALEFYPKHKDFNDFFINQPKNQ